MSHLIWDLAIINNLESGVWVMGKTKRIKKEQKLAQNTANGAANQDGEPELGDNRSDKPVIGHLIG